MPESSVRPLDGMRTARRGLLIVGILLVAANMRASITALSPLLAEVRVDLHLSAPIASALISVPLIAFALFSPIAPRIAGLIGIERTLWFSLVLLAAGIVLRSLPWLPGLWIGTAALGVAIAVLNVELPSLIKRDFPHDVGRMTGLYSSVQGVAAAIASGIAVPIADAPDGGWRIALGIWAGLAVIALAVFLPQLRERSIPDDPEAEVRRHPGGYRSPWGSALAWQVTFFMGMQSTVFYSVLAWWPSIDHSHGFSPTTAGLHQVVYQVCTVLGCLGIGVVLHRRTGDQRILAAALGALMLAGIVGELAVPLLSPVWIGAAGLGGGSSLVLALSMFGFRTHNHDQAAALSGMAQSIGYVLAAGGPILAGVLHDASGSWAPVLWMLAGVSAVLGIAGYFAGRDRLI